MSSIVSLPKHFVGLIFGASAVIGWGIFNAFTHQALIADIYPNDLTMLRYCVSGVLCVPIAIVLKVHRLDLNRWLKMLGLSVCGGPLFGWLVNQGIQRAPLSHASVMVPTLTMLITLLVVFVQGKPINKNQCLGAAIIVLGLLALVSGQSGSTSTAWLGDLDFLVAAILWSGFTLLLNRWKMPVFQSVVTINMLSGLAYLPFFFLQSHHDLGQIAMATWVEQALIQGVLSAIIVIYAYSQAVKYCGVETASMLPALIPITSLFTNFVITGEAPQLMVIGSLAIIMVGFVIATRAPKSRKPSKSTTPSAAPLTH